MLPRLLLCTALLVRYRLGFSARLGEGAGPSGIPGPGQCRPAAAADLEKRLASVLRTEQGTVGAGELPPLPEGAVVELRRGVKQLRQARRRRQKGSHQGSAPVALLVGGSGGAPLGVALRLQRVLFDGEAAEGLLAQHARTRGDAAAAEGLAAGLGAGALQADARAGVMHVRAQEFGGEAGGDLLRDAVAAQLRACPESVLVFHSAGGALSSSLVSGVVAPLVKQQAGALAGPPLLLLLGAPEAVIDRDMQWARRLLPLAPTLEVGGAPETEEQRLERLQAAEERRRQAQEELLKRQQAAEEELRRAAEAERAKREAKAKARADAERRAAAQREDRVCKQVSPLGLSRVRAHRRAGTGRQYQTSPTLRASRSARLRRRARSLRSRHRCRRRRRREARTARIASTGLRR
jgi:hypothetical protein